MKPWHRNNRTCFKAHGQRGASAVEFAIILPILLMMVFAAIDFGRLFHARLVLTNLSREGASLVSREIKSATQVSTMLQAGASPLDMSANGKIYIWVIKEGNKTVPYPTASKSADVGSLNVPSTINNDPENMLGLNKEVYDQLVYDDAENKKTANISQIAVVEVFYLYKPITPIVIGNKVLSSRAVF